MQEDVLLYLLYPTMASDVNSSGQRCCLFGRGESMIQGRHLGTHTGSLRVPTNKTDNPAEQGVVNSHGKCNLAMTFSRLFKTGLSLERSAKACSKGSSERPPPSPWRLSPLLPGRFAAVHANGEVSQKILAPAAHRPDSNVRPLGNLRRGIVRPPVGQAW